MSYDYYVMKLKHPVGRAVDLKPEALAIMGDSVEVRQAIASVVPGVEWMDGTCQRE